MKFIILMATQYNSIIRLKKIDECLRTKTKVYDLPKLIDTISNELASQGKKVKVSERTVYDDLKFLKDEYGPFAAPIVRTNEKGYHYKEDGYSIFNPYINGDNTKVLQSSMAALRQVSNMKGFDELKNILFRIEANYHFDKNKLTDPIVYLEEGLNIAAQEHIKPLKECIKKEKTILITYQPFDKDPYSRIISPYFLKEYNNRWFLFGHQHAVNKGDYSGITNVPLDRIKSMKASFKDYIDKEELDVKTYFDHVIGVTVSESEIEHIEFKVYGNRRHYVQTKKIHKSQTTLEMNNDFGVFTIAVKPNRELYSHLLEFGGDLEVVKPKEVRKEMKKHIQRLASRY